jgi:hypothetical protein
VDEPEAEHVHAEPAAVPAGELGFCPDGCISQATLDYIETWEAAERLKPLYHVEEAVIAARGREYEESQADPPTRYWGEYFGGPNDGEMTDLRRGYRPSRNGQARIPAWHLEGEASYSYGTSGTLGWYTVRGWADKSLRVARLEWQPGWEDGIG